MQRVITIGEEHYLTAEEACTRLGVKLATLYSYVHRGLVKSYRQGIRRQRLYRVVEIEQLLQVTPVREEPVVIPLAESWTLEH